MTDDELQVYWPDLALIVTELRRVDRPDVSNQIIRAVLGSATSGEILGSVGIVLNRNQDARARLGDREKRAWQAVMADVYRAYPGSRLSTLLGQIFSRRS